MNRREFTKTVSLGAVGFSMMSFEQAGVYPIDELLGRKEPALFGAGYNLRKEASVAFAKMQKDALKEGLQIYSASSYRSYARQESIWNRKYDRFTGQGLSPIKAIEKIIEYSTIPGTSRHHWGTDMDIIDKSVPTPEDSLLEEHFNPGGCYEPLKKWLNANANTYGFCEVYTNTTGRKGFNYEPWHFSYKPLSQPMLQEYKEIDLKQLLQQIKLKGAEHFTDDFVAKYRRENVLDINEELL